MTASSLPTRAARLLVPDVWRATAVILMVIFHFFFLGWFRFGWSITPTSGAWRWLAAAGGWSFLIVAGWSVWLQYQSRKGHFTTQRVLQIGGWAGVITVLTLLVVPRAPIWWGVLHCLASSLLVAQFFLRRQQAQTLAWLGAVTFLLGSVIRTWHITGGGAWSIPFGLAPSTFRSLDYYPLAPYAGLVWMAAGWGKHLTHATRGLEQRLRSDWPGKRAVLWIGQHSLAIYLSHVPILYVLLWVSSKF